jgi:hypothetical protein
VHTLDVTGVECRKCAFYGATCATYIVALDFLDKTDGN